MDVRIRAEVLQIEEVESTAELVEGGNRTAPTVLFPDSTATTARPWSVTAAEISAGSGPELPMQVVQPKATRWKPSCSNGETSPARAR